MKENTILSNNNSSFIHPLLHQNTSSYHEQRFTSTFTGKEPFLEEFIVNGRLVFPAVACLEMARLAIYQTFDISEDERPRILWKEITFVDPIIFNGQPVELHIGLFPEETGEIVWEIYSDPEDHTQDVIVHSQGSLEFPDGILPEELRTVKKLSLPTLRRESSQQISAEECYEIFESMGIKNGLGRQIIEKLYLGNNKTLAKFDLPVEFNDKHFFALPSFMIKSIVQTSLFVGFLNDFDAVPSISSFTLEEVEIFRGCSSNMWSLVRCEDELNENGLKILCIDLCDELGNVCVTIKKGYKGTIAQSSDASLLS